MREKRLEHTRSAGAGLERSCRRASADWIESSRTADGVELFRARLVGEAYHAHRHDTYAVGVTDAGVQIFNYRGAARTSMPGDVVTLYPDEVHDGRAGTSAGFGYRIVYVEPARLAEAVRAVRGRPSSLPFVREAVSTNRTLARAVARAFRAALSPLAVDDLVVALAEGLIAGADGARAESSRRVDVPAVERARELLDAERTRVVHSSELEAITGLTRYDLARQFRIRFGTSPHRYLVMRRLDLARTRIQRGDGLAAIAADVGFADQAHLTRVFRGAFGITPSRYRALLIYAATESAVRRRTSGAPAPSSHTRVDS